MKQHISYPTHAVHAKLLKYQHPVLLNPFQSKRLQHSLLEKATKEQHGLDSEMENECFAAGSNKQMTQELLDKIFPPKKWSENGLRWMHSVSSDPASRDDVISLEIEFNKLLIDKHARDTGICPIRKKQYSEMFDEIIREAIVSNSTRGLLLLRIREECRNMVEKYRSIYASSCAYGMRKGLSAEFEKRAMEKKIQDIENEKNELATSIQDWGDRTENIIRRWTEKRIADEKRHYAEVQYIKKNNSRLKQQLESLVRIKGLRKQKDSATTSSKIIHDEVQGEE